MVLRRRHFVKALTWRISGTVATSMVIITKTGSIEMGLIIGPIDFLIKLFLYYIHERLWLRTKFGIKNNGHERTSESSS